MIGQHKVKKFYPPTHIYAFNLAWDTQEIQKVLDVLLRKEWKVLVWQYSLKKTQEMLGLKDDALVKITKVIMYANTQNNDRTSKKGYCLYVYILLPQSTDKESELKWSYSPMKKIDFIETKQQYRKVNAMKGRIDEQ